VHVARGCVRANSAIRPKAIREVRLENAHGADPASGTPRRASVIRLALSRASILSLFGLLLHLKLLDLQPLTLKLLLLVLNLRLLLL
jgi:hypothetical protein